MIPLYKKLCISLFFSLLISMQAFAITVYDVIQLSNKNYSDKDIIALVKVTGSSFDLKGEDIKNLKELGVSKTVIQAMLDGSAAVSADTPPHVEQHVKEKLKHNSNQPPPVSSPHEGKGFSASDVVSNSAAVEGSGSRSDFYSKRIDEHGAGGHQHQGVFLSGIKLFVLRDEGNYPSLNERAQAVVSRLIQAASMAGEFHSAHEAGSDGVSFSPNQGETAFRVITVSAKDARAYQRRSGRRVTADILSAYWSDLLTDYWSILAGQTPKRLTGIHEGEALLELYEAVKKSVDEKVRVPNAWESLPVQEQNHLQKLAVSVPHDFSMTNTDLEETTEHNNE